MAVSHSELDLPFLENEDLSDDTLLRHFATIRNELELYYLTDHDGTDNKILIQELRNEYAQLQIFSGSILTATTMTPELRKKRLDEIEYNLQVLYLRIAEIKKKKQQLSDTIQKVLQEMYERGLVDKTVVTYEGIMADLGMKKAHPSLRELSIAQCFLQRAGGGGR